MGYSQKSVYFLILLLISCLVFSCSEKEIEVVSPSGGYQEFEFDNGSKVKLGPQSTAKYKSSAETFNLTGEAVLQVAPGRSLTAVTPNGCLLYTSPSPRDRQKSRMPSSA